MRNNLLFIMFWPLMATAQYSGHVDDYRLGTAELVVFPFGMDHKIVLGEIKKDGNFRLDFVSLEDIEVPNKDLWYADIPETLLISCDEQSLVFSDTIAQAFTVDNIFIWQDEAVAGMLFAVTNLGLKEWLEELYFADIMSGRFLNFIYVDRPTSLTGKCVIEHTLEEPEGVIKEQIVYNVVLSAGWNILENSIDKIVKLQEGFSIPTEQRIETLTTISKNYKWVVKSLE
jgi:hypothetical protein